MRFGHVLTFHNTDPVFERKSFTLLFGEVDVCRVVRIDKEKGRERKEGRKEDRNG